MIVVGLNIPTGVRVDLNASIDQKGITPEIVIVTHSSDDPDSQGGPLGDLLIALIGVTGDGISNIRFENANGVGLSGGLLTTAVRCVPIGRMVRAIITRRQTTRLSADAIESVVIACSSLERIITGILCDSICFNVSFCTSTTNQSY